jgi:hypothetical protein
MRTEREKHKEVRMGKERKDWRRLRTMRERKVKREQGKESKA